MTEYEERAMFALAMTWIFANLGVHIVFNYQLTKVYCP